jgi:hypothetical protein
MLDQIFGENSFVNEVVWKRQTSHNDAKQVSRHFGRLHDTIFFYVRSDAYVWNHQYGPLDPSYVESHYSQVDETGRCFQWGDLRAPGGAAPSKGNSHYKVLGVEGYWRYSQERMEQFIREGRVAIPPRGKTDSLEELWSAAPAFTLPDFAKQIRPGQYRILGATLPAARELGVVNISTPYSPQERPHKSNK